MTVHGISGFSYFARHCMSMHRKGFFRKMIKGIGRYVVEVESVDSEFFERVICFVRPQYTCGSGLDLHREAERVADNLSAEVEDAQHGTRHVLRVNASHKHPPEQRTRQYSIADAPSINQNRRGSWLPLLISAGGGAAAAMLITAIF